MTERTDAARNRAAVLSAATELFEREDLQHVSLARIARAAGVGKATVLRRFGDLLGLIQAVIAIRVHDLQHQMQCGPPPLGPGGADRSAHLHAYLDALFDFVLANRKLLRALEAVGPNAYYDNPASQFWIEELTGRIHANRPGVDAGYLAYAVFTALRADVIDYLTHDQNMDANRIRTGLHTLAEAGPLPR